MFRAFFAAWLLLMVQDPCWAGERLNAQAGPNVWGPELRLAAHLGKVTYVIEYKAVGKTKVIGEARYFKTPDQEVRVKFIDRIQFTTANVVAQPSVRFKGVPFGSAVKVTVRP